MNNCEDRFARCSEIIQRLNGMDDTFFQKLAESKEVYEEIIRIIIGDENICIAWVQTQKYLRNCGKRSVILDAIGMSTSDCYYCIEMEKSDKHNHQKRVRYNASNVDTMVTEQGISFEELPEVYSIYLSKKDFIKKKRTCYRIHRIVENDMDILHNGQHEIYVNSQINDGSICAELMQYLKNTDPTEIHPAFPKTVARVRYLKLQQGGLKEMCELVEKYAREVAAEAAAAEAERTDRKTVVKMFKNGASLEFVSACIERFSLDELNKIRMESLN